MAFQQDELWAVKTGAAVLAVCMVRTLQKSGHPDIENDFLEQLDRAYDHFRDNPGKWTRADGSPRDPQDVFEIIAWTRELLTGWNNVTGQGDPLLK